MGACLLQAAIDGHIVAAVLSHLGHCHLGTGKNTAFVCTVLTKLIIYYSLQDVKKKKTSKRAVIEDDEDDFVAEKEEEKHESESSSGKNLTKIII